MGKAKNQTIGYEYYMGLHMGIARGPVNELCEITVGDRQAWQGSVTGNTQIYINQPDLFGGHKGEGGIKGTLDVMMGGPGQVKSPKLAAMLTGLQPQFRGFLSVFFDGMVCAMSPYPKPWKFRARRTTAGWDGGTWYPDKATIILDGYYDDGTTRQITAMNPVHIIYESLTNRQWGLGRDRSLFLEDTWRKAADTVYDEQFGLCIRWSRQDTLMSFVQVVIDHIGCAVYVDKFTGKYKIKMIRNDYDADSLPIVDMDSGLLKINEATNASTFNLLNEIVVNCHNPVTNNDFQMRAHNLALIETQKALNSDTRDYPGIPTPKLGNIVAQRDLKAASTNVRRFNVDADRRLWHIQPGDVFKLRDPKSRGIETVIVRVGNVEENPQTDGTLKITAVQDVFGINLNTFTGVQPPNHVEPDTTPKLARRVVYEATYAELSRMVTDGEFNAIQRAEGFIHAHAEKPNPIHMAFDLAVRPQGVADFSINGNGDFTPLAELAVQIDYLTNSLTYWKEGDDFSDPEEVYPGMAIMIGKQEQNEIIRVVSIDRTAKTMSIARGCWDTIPQRHFAGELIWAIQDNGGTDYTKYLSGETVDMKILPWTLRGGRFPIEQAPIDSLPFKHRFFRPYAPGRLQVKTLEIGQARPWYFAFDLRADATTDEVPDFATFTWTHRDRPLQQDKLIDHAQDSIGPEPGTLYRFRVFNATGEMVRNETGIAGSQFVYTYQMAASDTKVEEGATESTSGTVFIDSLRDGVESWMYYTTPFTVHKKPPQTAQVAFMSMQTVSDDTDITDETDSASGGQVAQIAQAVVQPDTAIEDESDSTAGGQVSLLSTSATQFTKLLPVIDMYLYEAPYLSLLREGRNPTRSQLMAFVARPSDRATDGYDLADRPQGTAGWTNNGAGPWTPWGLLKGFIAHLTNEFEVNESSDTDGVPINSVQVGDLLLIDNELLAVEGVNGKRFTIGRGVADTIPAPHYAKAVVWLFDRSHAAADRLYGNEQVAEASLVPHTFAFPIQAGDMPIRQLAMQFRPIRPYPVGLLLVDGKHWYERGNGLADNFDGTKPQGRDVTFTWAHRNRLTQGDRPYDHYATGIASEPGVMTRVWVGYTIQTRQGVEKVTLGTFMTADAGITITKAQLEAWGPKAGLVLEAPGYVALVVSINNMRDGIPNWQGYDVIVIAPSYPMKPGDTPGGGQIPPDPNYPDPGSPDPGPGTGPNPGEGGGTNPNPGGGTTDPEVPGTNPPDPEGPEKPDPDNVFGWSINWDHGWAANLPDQSAEKE